MSFNSAMTALHIVVKGRLPTDLNNPSGKIIPGYVATFAINQTDMTLSKACVNSTVNAAFSVEEDMFNPDLFLMADVTTGYATFDSSQKGFMVNQQVIPNEAAVSWFYLPQPQSSTPTNNLEITGLLVSSITSYETFLYRGNRRQE
jgi:hypothetical protein